MRGGGQRTWGGVCHVRQPHCLISFVSQSREESWWMNKKYLTTRCHSSLPISSPRHRVQTTKKWLDPCYSNHKIFHGDGLICMLGIWNKFLVILNMEPLFVEQISVTCGTRQLTRRATEPGLASNKPTRGPPLSKYQLKYSKIQGLVTVLSRSRTHAEARLIIKPHSPGICKPH